MSDKFRRKKEPKHVRLYASITGTEAWLHLSGNGVKVLIALASLDDGTRNGELYFGERFAATKTGLSRNTVRRALTELMDKGFIAQTKPGAFNRNGLLAATYRLTWVAWPGGHPAAPTRDFDKWKHGNSQAQILTPTGASFDPKVETRGALHSNSDPGCTETSDVSNDALRSNIEPQVIYHGSGEIGLETEQRKQANSYTRADLASLRDWTLAHRQRHGLGAQSGLADTLEIPAGTLSKFINGGGLPERYRAPLAEYLRDMRSPEND